jgi:hypothetical protein
MNREFSTYGGEEKWVQYFGEKARRKETIGKILTWLEG